jgi:hypothetical protein
MGQDSKSPEEEINVIIHRKATENAEFIFILLSAERAESKKESDLRDIWRQLVMVTVH